ncbi:MAG: hypothetical protein LQ338_007590, partial [Usnochroma carphineum]
MDDIVHDCTVIAHGRQQQPLSAPPAFGLFELLTVSRLPLTIFFVSRGHLGDAVEN